MNNKVSKKAILFNYAVVGFLVGAMFPVGAWIFEMIIEGINISFFNIPYIHQQNKLIFLIDTAPIVLCLFALIGGIKQVNIIKITEKLTSSFEELKHNKESLNKNEILKLSAMKESTKIVDEISHISESLNNNTSYFYKGINVISESGNQIKNAAIAASDLINCVLDFSQEIADFSNECLDETKSSIEIGDNGLKFVKETVKNMESISQEISIQKKEFKDMLSKVEKATEMLNFIEEISSKTKNLAMNASIEAARAGEFGKSFNIIAKEVRQLSDMSKNSTKTITEIFSQLNNSVDLISERINNIENCISKAQIVSKKMDSDIVSLIESLGLSSINIEKISEMTFEQKDKIVIIEQDSSEIKDIAINMDNILNKSQEMLKENELLIHNLYNTVKDFTLIYNEKTKD